MFLTSPQLLFSDSASLTKFFSSLPFLHLPLLPSPPIFLHFPFLFSSSLVFIFSYILRLPFHASLFFLLALVFYLPSTLYTFPPYTFFSFFPPSFPLFLLALKLFYLLFLSFQLPFLCLSLSSHFILLFTLSSPATYLPSFPSSILVLQLFFLYLFLPHTFLNYSCSFILAFSTILCPFLLFLHWLLPSFFSSLCSFSSSTFFFSVLLHLLLSSSSVPSCFHLLSARCLFSNFTSFCQLFVPNLPSVFPFCTFFASYPYFPYFL